MRWVAMLAMAGFVGLCGYAGSEARASEEEKVELSGTAKNVKGKCPNVQFEIAGAKVKTTASTDFDDDCKDLAEGKHVEVEGKMQGEKVAAEEVEID